MSYQRIITSTEINEPVPIAGFEQRGHGMEGVGQHSGASVCDQIRLSDDPHIVRLHEDWLVRHETDEPPAFAGRCLEVQVEEVEIGRVVNCLEDSFQLAHITLRG